jgi:deazaflavin-dependent oxidoreductase (nitroreductase family)
MAKQVSLRGNVDSELVQVLAESDETSSGFASELPRSQEINISVVGRKSGKNISTPVWFVYSEPEKQVHLLPVRGSKSAWFKNLQANPELKVSLGERKLGVKATAELDQEKARRVAEKFKAKYGEEDVSKYYPMLDSVVTFSIE